MIQSFANRIGTTAICLHLVGICFSSATFAIVDTKNANFSDTWVDLSLPGTGYNLEVKRTYNSRTLFNGIFGFGWCSDFETFCEVTPENIIRVTECGGGAEITYAPKSVDPLKSEATVKEIMAAVREKNKKLTPQFLAKLEKDLQESPVMRREFTRELKLAGKVKEGLTYYANGSKADNIVFKDGVYTRRLPDGTYQKFDQQCRLRFMHDKNGNFVKLDYDNELLSSVTDNNGRKLSLTIDPKTKKLKQIKGPNELIAKYEIEKENLVAVTNAWGNSFKYAYDDLHNLVKISFPDKTTKELTYNKEKDWVTSFKDRKGCLEKYNYGISETEPKNHYWTDVIKTCGKEVTNKSKYEFWHKDGPKGSGKYLYRVRVDNNNNITDTVYHETLAKPVSIVRNGRRTLFEYHPNGLVKLKKEELRSTEFEYDKKCLKPNLVTTNFFEVALKADTDKKAKKNQNKRKTLKTVKTKYAYDPVKCNLMVAQNSDGQIAKIQYDANGRIGIIKDQTKKIVKIQYEGQFGKPSIVSIDTLGTINVTYNSNGDIKDVKSGDGPKVAVQVASIFNNLLDLIAPATSEATL